MVFGWFKKQAAPKQVSSPQEVYAGMRGQILSIKPSEFGLSPTDAMPAVWGVLMEFGRPGALVTLVSLADNTTSLYFSNGGGVIGAGAHQPVAAATQSYIAMAQQYLSHFQLTAEYPAPAVDKVRFYLLTFSGVVTAEADEQDLGNHRHPLSPLFHKAHEVIGCVRMSTEKQ